MIKTFIGVAFLCLVAGLVVAATWMQAQQDLADAWQACTSESEFVRHVTRARSQEELDRYVESVLACVEKRQTMLSALYYDRADLQAKWEREMRPATRLYIEQMNQAREQLEELESLQEDAGAAYELEAFRRGAHRSGDQR